MRRSRQIVGAESRALSFLLGYIHERLSVTQLELIAELGKDDLPITSRTYKQFLRGERLAESLTDPPSERAERTMVDRVRTILADEKHRDKVGADHDLLRAPMLHLDGWNLRQSQIPAFKDHMADQRGADLTYLDSLDLSRSYQKGAVKRLDESPSLWRIFRISTTNGAKGIRHVSSNEVKYSVGMLFFRQPGQEEYLHAPGSAGSYVWFAGEIPHFSLRVRRADVHGRDEVQIHEGRVVVGEESSFVIGNVQKRQEPKLVVMNLRENKKGEDWSTGIAIVSNAFQETISSIVVAVPLVEPNFESKVKNKQSAHELNKKRAKWIYDTLALQDANSSARIGTFSRSHILAHFTSDHAKGVLERAMNSLDQHIQSAMERGYVHL